MREEKKKKAFCEGFCDAAHQTLQIGMVPDTGSPSNSLGGALVTAWEAKDKGKNEGADLFSDPLRLDELFSTLADWNEYLENHVPHYSKEPMEGGPK